jgi:hypothetical protein
MRGRGRWVIAGGVAVVAIVAVGAFVAWRTLAAPAAAAVPRFIDETSTAGIDLTYGGDDTFDVGGGVAVFDCNGDGLPDVYAAGGGDGAALFRNESPTGGALRFARVPSPVTDLDKVSGAYALDVDGDGVTDLIVLRQGESVALRGLGDCRFERANEAWHLAPTPAFTTAFSATWEQAFGLPTLAFGSYLDPASPPGQYVCSDNELLRPAGAGNGYGTPIPLRPGFCTLSMLFSDWDGSGRRDLRMSNDRQYYDDAVGGEQLWRIAPGEAPRPYEAADGWRLLQLWGMGIASDDVTGDGYPEVYLTTQGANTLQTLAAGPSLPAFHDLAFHLGLEATRPTTGGDPLPSTAWHPEFQDVNNDGRIDLFVSKGNVDAIPDYAMKDPSNLFLGQPDGSFVDAAEAAGIVRDERGRGAALADFNADGLPDLVEVFLHEPVRVWRNVGSGTADAPAPMGSWLAYRLHEDGGNRDAIGAVVETQTDAQTTRQELTVGGGHIGGERGWQHVGLGAASRARVRVTWPDGEVGPWLDVAANQFVDIARGATEAVPWTPPQG